MEDLEKFGSLKQTFLGKGFVKLIDGSQAEAEFAIAQRDDGQLLSKKKSRQFSELIVFVLIILSLGMSCKTRGEITNTRVPPTVPAQPNAAVMTLLERGSDYLQADDYDLAIASFDKAIELDSQFAFSYASRGIAYYYKNYFDEAIADFDKAIELDPKLFSARIGAPTAVIGIYVLGIEQDGFVVIGDSEIKRAAFI